jgi:hypothetical protein
VVSLLALIALGLAWELWLAPLRPGGSWLALKVLPLALALPGLLRFRMLTYRWLALLVWLYFTEGVVRAAGDPGLSARWRWPRSRWCCCCLPPARPRCGCASGRLARPRPARTILIDSWRTALASRYSY